MKKNKNILSFISISAYLLISTFVFAQQSKIDSLLILLKKDKSDTSKVNHLNNLGRELMYSNPDTSIILANQAISLGEKLQWKKGIANSYAQLGACNLLKGDFQKALDYYLKALKIDEEMNNKEGMAKRYGNIGNVYRSQPDYPKALDYYSKALKTGEELGDKNGIAKTLANIGLVYHEQADYPKALDYYLKGLKMDEEMGYKQLQANALGNIGLVYAEQREYPKALDYYLKALKIDEALANKNGISIRLGNIGIVYHEQGDYSKALEYYLKALKMKEELGNKLEIAITLGNIGIVYKEKANYPNVSSVERDSLLKRALDYYFKGLKMAEELEAKDLTASTLGNIGSLYTDIGKFKEAEQELKKALAIDTAIRFRLHEENTYECLSQLYDTTAHLAESSRQYAAAALNYKLAMHFYKKEISLRDTLFSEENKKQLVRKEMNFDFEKKEAAAKAEQEKQAAVAAAESKKQKIVIWSVIAVLLLVAVFAGFVFRSLRLTRKQKQVIEMKSRETEEQKKIIEEKQKDILDSIRYASAIQQAVITSESYIAEHLQEFFILYLPKDIVAGDFYWAYHRDDEFFIATGDCTGHGVPGAFMSLMGINFLNEIIVEKKISSPAECLNRLREHILNTFAFGKSDRKDGMDMCFYTLSKKERRLTYAGANNPLWIVREKQLHEYKPDKMPVGTHHGITTPFSEQTIELQKDDIIYSFTDGFADQFGGTKGKKFKYKQLEEKLAGISHLPMSEQKKELVRTFEDWKGNLEQVDDVLVIGVRI